MDVTRTVKVPNTIYTLTSTLAPGVHTLTWAPATTTNPRTFLVRITAVDRAGNRIVYGAAERVRRPRTARASSSASRGSTPASASRAMRPGRSRASTSRPMRRP